MRICFAHDIEQKQAHAFEAACFCKATDALARLCAAANLALSLWSIASDLNSNGILSSRI